MQIIKNKFDSTNRLGQLLQSRISFWLQSKTIQPWSHCNIKTLPSLIQRNITNKYNKQLTTKQTYMNTNIQRYMEHVSWNM